MRAVSPFLGPFVPLQARKADVEAIEYCREVQLFWNVSFACVHQLARARDKVPEQGSGLLVSKLDLCGRMVE